MHRTSLDQEQRLFHNLLGKLRIFTEISLKKSGLRGKILGYIYMLFYSTYGISTDQ
jgi:hypothetical protein